ncbi:MAG: hypothetical protein H0T76_05070, partial [Nannocystis sp.]
MRSNRVYFAVVLVVIACSAEAVEQPAGVAPPAIAEVAAVVPAGVPAGVMAQDDRDEVVEVGAALPEPWPDSLRWIAAGGGSTPEFNQVSIEQDLGLAQATFGADGLLLFAGGRGSHGVQVEVSAPQGDELLLELGELFSPRGGRDSRYRRTTLPVDAAATAENLRLALERASAVGERPLLVYLAGHGQRGEQPAEASIDLWGQRALQAFELAAVLDAGARPVRLVMTTCFSGGFAELAFVDADAGERRVAPGRCGLFAATAEREASGCDPNPDRAAQEGYGLHFLNALAGRDRAGRPAEIDLDGDGRVSLLEAHARARSVSAGIDVPTTTSERWLRAVPGLKGRSAAVDLREDDAVIAALVAALGLGEGEAAAQLQQVQDDMVVVTDRLDKAAQAEDAGYRATAAELLARWPVLDDPWHPDFAATLGREREAIAGWLAASEGYAGYRAARSEGDAARTELGAGMARSAKLERLVRALETRALVGRLKA